VNSDTAYIILERATSVIRDKEEGSCYHIALYLSLFQSWQQNNYAQTFISIGEGYDINLRKNLQVL
jgi:hypothetical protein